MALICGSACLTVGLKATRAGLLKEGIWGRRFNFFKQPWSPGTRPSDAYGYVYAYDEQGSLIGEYGTGGAHSTGSKQYVYLPTAAGPMFIVVMDNDTRYAVVADHLNTPRRVTHPDGGLMWQWGYSAFGDEQPTVAGRRFNKVAALESDFGINLRYPGQYFDAESNLHYNGFRTYNPTVGRYTQGDPIGLDGGWNRFGYVSGNPLKYADPLGLINQEAQRQLNQWFGPKTPSGNCATAECAAGLPPAPSENRSQKEVDYGQCKMVCQIALALPVAACNATLGGGLAGTAAAAVAKSSACSWVCK